MAGFRAPSDGEEISVLPIIVNWYTNGISRASIQLDGEELLIFTPDIHELGLNEVSLRRRRSHRRLGFGCFFRPLHLRVA